jgi:hypothetical protein
MPAESVPTTPGALVTRRRVLLAAGTALGVTAGAAAICRRLPKSYCRRHRLDTLTPERVERVRSNLDAVREVYAECRDELASDLGRPFADLPADDLPPIFCMLLANAMAPYGKSTARELPDLLAASDLHCGNYPVLMLHLHDRLAAPADPPVALLGWEAEFFGPHDLAYRPHPDAERCMFLDPTTALVARATFDHVVSGGRVDRNRIACFAYRESEVPNAMWMAQAFAEGKFKPSELVYYFESLEHRLERFGDHAEWPTPGAARQRSAARRKRSPGA